MADNGNERRMLSGWKSITFGVSVIGLFGAGIMFVLGQIGLVLECVTGALALMLSSAVLEWMGEVEHHLRQIAARTDATHDKPGPGEQNDSSQHKGDA